MIEQTIIFGNLFATTFELILCLKQLRKLKTSEYTQKYSDIIEKADFYKMKMYNSSKLKYSILVDIFNLFKLFLTIKYSILPEIFEYVATNAKSLSSYNIQILAVIIYFAADKMTLVPFTLYYNFCIEAKYGFNKMTLPLFISDYFKTEFLTHSMIYIMFYAILYIIDICPKSFYLQVFLFVSIFQLIMIVLFPIVIQPLFNKFTELDEDSLKTKIIELAKKIGFKPSKILVMDGSKRSHHSNAYFIGIFKEKRIVLFDTLLKQVNDEEILAILCHEFGHWYFSHTFKQIFFVFALMFFYIYGFNKFIFINDDYVALKLIYFSLIINFVNPILTFTQNSITRRYERQADAFAVKENYGNGLKSGLVKIHVDNKSNLCVDEWYSAYNHSHPTLFERIEFIDREMKKNE